MSAPALTHPQPVKMATKKDVRRVAKEMSDEFLRCRDMGHNWRQSRVEKVGRGYERTLYCSSCKTNRTQNLDRHGVVTHNRYDYAEGYQIKGIGRMGDAKAALRLVSLGNAIDHSSRHEEQDGSGSLT